jgi:hypothetical protein
MLLVVVMLCTITVHSLSAQGKKPQPPPDIAGTATIASPTDCPNGTIRPDR